MLVECSLYEPLRLGYDDLFQAPVVQGKRVMRFAILNQQPAARAAKYVAECKSRHAQELAEVAEQGWREQGWRLSITSSAVVGGSA